MICKESSIASCNQYKDEKHMITNIAQGRWFIYPQYRHIYSRNDGIKSTASNVTSFMDT